MAQPTNIDEHALPNAMAGQPESALGKLGAGIKLVVTRSIFWSYQRGSWQYDVIVIVILAFIFLSPRSWFKDRPTLQLTDLRHQQGISIGHLSIPVDIAVKDRGSIGGRGYR